LEGGIFVDAPEFDVSLTNMKSRTAKMKRSRQYVQGARAEAAEETGRRIVEAFIGRLLKAGLEVSPLEKIAADAGVTVQTVVRRFGGKEGVLAQTVQAFGDRVRATRAAPVGDVEKIVQHLLADYEQTGDMVMRMLASEARYEPLRQFLNIGRGEHRKWVQQAFADVLEKREAGRRQRLTDQLVILTDVYTWQLLRRDMKRSVPETTATLVEMIKGVIGGVDPARCDVERKNKL
jgi:AcrR family transcriptional regulator